MSTKRIILANNSRLLREMLRHVLGKADGLEIVQESPGGEEIPSAIEKFDPEWVILSLPSNGYSRDCLETCMAQYPGVRFILLSPGNNAIRIRMRGQAAFEEDLSNLSLRDFIHVLAKDLQHT
ncbi:MAG: DNA-binding response regulator [Chloroflexi bacterium]|nr:MAG: DNA-binding response regulator [Chloroflexota bacterium]